MYIWCTDRGLTTDQWILIAQLGVFGVQALIFWRQVQVARETSTQAGKLSGQIAKDAADLQKAMVRPCLGLDFAPDVKNGKIIFSVLNVASGAAKIREMRVYVDGNEVASSLKTDPENFWQEVQRAVGPPIGIVRTGAAIPPKGYLLVPGNRQTVLVELHYPPGTWDRDALLRLGERIQFDLKAESTLGEVVTLE